MGKFVAKSGPMAQKQSGTQKARIEQQAPGPSHLPVIGLSYDELPSKGICYPKDGTISYRPYTFGEVKRISQSKLGIKEKYKEALEGINVSFGSENLTASDALYISLLRKLSSIGTAKAVVPFLCTSCFKSNRATVETKDLEFDDLSMEKSMLYADLACGELAFSPLTIKDYFGLLNVGKEEDELAILAAQCRNLDFDKAYESLDTLPPQDAPVLDDIDEALYHGLKAKEFECKHCKQKTIIELDGGQALFLPFRPSNEPVQNRIRFEPKAKR